MQSSGKLLVPLTLWRSDAFVTEAGRRDLGWGLYYGFLLALALYVGYLVAMVGFQASLAGHAFQHLWAGSPSFANVAVGALLAASVSCAVLFVRKMVDVAENAPRLRRPLTATIGALVVAAAALWIDYTVAIRTITALAAGALVLLAVAIVLAHRRGYRPAR